MFVSNGRDSERTSSSMVMLDFFKLNGNILWPASSSSKVMLLNGSILWPEKVMLLNGNILWPALYYKYFMASFFKLIKSESLATSVLGPH